MLPNFEDVMPPDLIPAQCVQGVVRIGLHRYLADKVQCIAERSEARDLLEPEARDLLEQDLILLSERLLLWTDEAIEKDLRPSPDIPVQSVIAGRNTLLAHLEGVR